MVEPRVLTFDDLPAECLAALRQVARVTVLPCTPPPAELLRERLEGHRVLLCRLTEPVNAKVLASPGLSLVSQIAVGLDNVDLAAAEQRGIAVAHTPGVLTDATADLTMALLLSAARRIPEASRTLAEGRWSTWRLDLLTGLELRGAQLGIVGLGRIGRAVAQRAQAFGMRVVYAGPREVPEADALGVTRCSLDALLADSDVISLHAPLNESTTRLLDSRRLRSVKEGAILVNTARGGLIDEEALAGALSDGPLGFAALDVFVDEPRVHPSLLGRDDVLLLPHIGSATRATRARMAALATEAVLDHLAGRPIQHRAV